MGKGNSNLLQQGPSLFPRGDYNELEKYIDDDRDTEPIPTKLSTTPCFPGTILPILYLPFFKERIHLVYNMTFKLQLSYIWTNVLKMYVVYRNVFTPKLYN